MSALEEKLDALIAKQDHVRPQDVTLEHIRRNRDEKPTDTYDFSTHYGGYNKRGGRVLTVAQTREAISTAYKFLGTFSKRKKSQA
jgi:low affinity Fe/Cu permease